MHAYTDASYADCPDTGKSTIGYIFFFGSAALSWYSKLHTYVTTCTNHSEYAALAQGAKEAQWMVYLFQELDPAVTHTPVPLFVDNAGAISLVLNPIDHQANKHIRLACHYTRELVEEKVVAPQRVPSSKNLADAFTKALGGTAFTRLIANYVNESPRNPVSTVRGGVLTSPE